MKKRIGEPLQVLILEQVHRDRSSGFRAEGTLNIPNKQSKKLLYFTAGAARWGIQGIHEYQLFSKQFLMLLICSKIQI